MKMLQELKEGKNQYVRILRKSLWKKEKFDPNFKMDFDRGSRGIPSAEKSKNSEMDLTTSGGTVMRCFSSNEISLQA